MAHILGHDRSQMLLLPETVDDYVGPDNPVRFIEAFVAGLDLETAGFARGEPAVTGRPGYAPADLLKLYIYGYLNRVRSSRRLVLQLHLCCRYGSLPGRVWEGRSVDVCCGLVGVAGGLGARVGGAQGADRACVRQGRNTGDRRSLSRRLAVRGRAQNRLASGRAGGFGAALPHAVAARAQPLGR